MSRSLRKTPIVGNTTATSEKSFKRRAHRNERAAVRIALAHDSDARDSHAFGNPWRGDKDGKQYIGDRHRHLMRK